MYFLILFLCPSLYICQKFCNACFSHTAIFLNLYYAVRKISLRSIESSYTGFQQKKFCVFCKKVFFHYLLPLFYGNQSLFSMEMFPLYYGNAPFILWKSPFILWKNSHTPLVARAPGFVKDYLKLY